MVGGTAVAPSRLMTKQVIRVPPLKAGMRVTFEVVADEGTADDDATLAAPTRADPKKTARKTRNTRTPIGVCAQPLSRPPSESDAEPESHAQPLASEQPEAHSPADSETRPAPPEPAAARGPSEAGNTVAPSAPAAHERPTPIPQAPKAPASRVATHSSAPHGSYVWSATRAPQRSQMIVLAGAAAVVLTVVALPRGPQVPAPVVEPVAPAVQATAIVARATPAPAPAAAKPKVADVTPGAATPSVKPQASAARTGQPTPSASPARAAKVGATPASPKIAKPSIPPRNEPTKRIETPKDNLSSPVASTRSDGAAVTATVSTDLPHEATPSETVRTEVAPVASTQPLVTLTGCLEMSVNGESFRLNGTDGTDAPKSRSWRSGFMRRRTAPVALEAAGTLGLKSTVGHRVAATGVLSGTTLRIASLRVVSSSCE
jgi:hypothetical protein